MIATGRRIDIVNQSDCNKIDCDNIQIHPSKVERGELNLQHLEVEDQNKIVDIINNSGVLKDKLGVVKGHDHHIKGL